MLRHFSRFTRRARTLCTIPSPSFATHQTYEALQDVDWVDRETDEQELLIEDAERQITSYRSEYDADAVAKGDGKERYEQMKSLYEMKEAAKIVSLYADHIKHVILDHEDMVGFFGNHVTVKEGETELAERTLTEYIDFVNSLENRDVKKKVEHELGRKAIMLKMVLSAENFSAKFGPIAGGDFITKTK